MRSGSSEAVWRTSGAAEWLPSQRCPGGVLQVLVLCRTPPPLWRQWGKGVGVGREGPREQLWICLVDRERGRAGGRGGRRAGGRAGGRAPSIPDLSLPLSALHPHVRARAPADAVLYHEPEKRVRGRGNEGHRPGGADRQGLEAGQRADAECREGVGDAGCAACLRATGRGNVLKGSSCTWAEGGACVCMCVCVCM